MNPSLTSGLRLEFALPFDDMVQAVALTIFRIVITFKCRRQYSGMRERSLLYGVICVSTDKSRFDRGLAGSR